MQVADEFLVAIFCFVEKMIQTQFPACLKSVHKRLKFFQISGLSKIHEYLHQLFTAVGCSFSQFAAFCMNQLSL